MLASSLRLTAGIAAAALLPYGVAAAAGDATAAPAGTTLSVPAGCDVTYTGPANGAWQDASAWSGGAPPTAAQSACIPAGAGTIVVAAGTTAHAKTVTAGSALRIDATGTLAVADATSTGAQVSAFTDLTVDGTLASAGSWITIAGDGVVDGRISGLSAVVRLLGGTLSGDGTIEPTFQAVAGTVEPGGAGVVGALTFANFYSQTADATLAIDLASDTSFDRLLPLSNAFLAGTIDVHVLGDYAPAVGTQWDFISGSPGIQQLDWVTQPSAFVAEAIGHGGRLRLTAPLASPTATPTPTSTPVATPEAIPAATPDAAPAATPLPGVAAPAPGPSPLLGCGSRRLVLSDVFRHGRRVALSGAADPALAGQVVTITFDGVKPVASARVATDGRFSATAPLPPASVGDGARYSAALGALRSLDLKLTRRLVLEPPARSGATVTLTGTVVPPLSAPAAPVVVRRQTGCGSSTIVKRFTPGRGGRFRVSLPAPATAAVALYRLSTTVRKSTRSRRTYPTDSLPLAG